MNQAWTKLPYRRRATAKVDLNDLKGALDDLNIAVKLDPGDNRNLMGRDEIKAMLAKQ